MRVPFLDKGGVQRSPQTAETKLRVSREDYQITPCVLAALRHLPEETAHERKNSGFPVMRAFGCGMKYYNIVKEAFSRNGQTLFNTGDVSISSTTTSAVGGTTPQGVWTIYITSWCGTSSILGTAGRLTAAGAGRPESPSPARNCCTKGAPLSNGEGGLSLKDSSGRKGRPSGYSGKGLRSAPAFPLPNGKA